jgi:hypothetical protein
VEKKAPTHREKKSAKDASLKAGPNSGASNTFEAYERLLNAVPQFAGFGKLFKVLFMSSYKAQIVFKFSFFFWFKLVQSTVLLYQCLIT